MIFGALTFLLQTAIAAPPSLLVRSGAVERTVPVVAIDGTPAVAANELASALGATVRAGTTGRYTFIFGESHLDLIEGVPFARSDSVVVPIVGVPAVSNGTLYLPFHVVSEVIPRLLVGVIYDVEAGEMRTFNTTARRGITTTARTSTAPVATVDATAVRPRHRKKHLVIVDAGHGGDDPGMSGPIGGGPKIYEKYITLAVAKLVAQALRDEGADVLMTRTTDTLIALADRGRIANRNHGDVFVSVHVNATGSRGRDAARERGYETYFLAEAKTEDARRVENMENEAVRFETGANAPRGDPLSYILNDMAQNEHLRESAELAQFVQDGFRAFHPGPDRGVQQANFAVLRGSFMPAVLVEIGFGTNPDEAAFISNSTNQRTIARSIAQAVMRYLDRYDARVGASR